MLDEPSLGLSPLLSNEVFALIGRSIARTARASSWWSRTRSGRSSSPTAPMCSSSDAIAMEGPPDRILADRTLHDAYLGQADSGAGRRTEFRRPMPSD